MALILDIKRAMVWGNVEPVSSEHVILCPLRLGITTEGFDNLSSGAKARQL